MKRALLFYLSAAFLCFFPLFAQAETITFNLDYLYNGILNLPPGQKSWLTASFEDKGDNSSSDSYNAIELKLVANGLTSYNEYVSGWYFNYDKGSILKFTFVSGQNWASKPATGAVSADGEVGKFNLLVDFPDAGDLFTNGETSIIKIEGYGISAESFNLFNVPGSFYSAAEITKKNGGGTSSAWIAATNKPTQPVPEPATMLLLSIGLIGMGFFSRKRFLK